MSPWKIILPIIVTSAATCLPASAQPPADEATNAVKAQAEKPPQAMNKKEMAEKLAKIPMVASEDELVAVKAPVASEDELVAVKSRVASEDELHGVKAPVASEDELVSAKKAPKQGAMNMHVKPDPVSEMAKQAIGSKARKVYKKGPHEATHVIQQGAAHDNAQKNTTTPFETEDIGIAVKSSGMKKGAIVSEITKDGADGKSSKRLSFDEAVAVCRKVEALQACIDEKTGQFE